MGVESCGGGVKAAPACTVLNARDRGHDKAKGLVGTAVVLTSCPASMGSLATNMTCCRIP